MLIRRAASIEKTEDPDTLWRAIVETLETVGFSHTIYLSVDEDFGAPLVCCTIAGLYDNSPPEDDPFLHYSCKSYDIIPVGTEFVADHPYMAARERDLVDRAGAGGFRSGLAIPTRLQGSERFGGFLVGTGLDRAAFLVRQMPRAEEVRLFCLLMHRRLEELNSLAAPQAEGTRRAPLITTALPEVFDGLSPREREVIFLLAQGRSRRQTAHICGISVHTVSGYAKSGYRKLRVHNRAEAAALIHASAVQP